MAHQARPVRSLNECRQCPTFCDRVIAPGACLTARCPALYAYDDPVDGTRYVGCVEKVFAVEIEEAALRRAERTRTGFGTVKVTGTPGSRCAFSIERAFEGPGTPCVNRRFADLPDEATGNLRAFDLRAGLEGAA